MYSGKLSNHLIYLYAIAIWIIDIGQSSKGTGFLRARAGFFI
jgi:hypothetical protein